MMIKLSICIPTYNRCNMLEQNLQRLLGQMTPNVEIVISDNASTDATSQMIKRLQAAGAAISYYQNAQNLGADRNYLLSVERAQGEFCWLMGSDDMPRIGAVQATLNLLDDEHDVYLFNRRDCRCDMEPITEKSWLPSVRKRTSFRLNPQTGDGDYLALPNSLGGVFSYLSSIVVRRDAWMKHPCKESFIGTAYSHVYVLLSVLRDGGALLYDPSALVDCRLNNDSFAASGVAKRILIDLNGYGRLRDEVMAGYPNWQEQINTLLIREYPARILARRRLDMNDAEWLEVVHALRGCHYPRRRILFAQLAGLLHAPLRRMIAVKRLLLHP